MRLKAKIAGDVMTRGPVSLDAERSAESAAVFLTERGFGAALVIDAAGHPIGVVTKTDLLIHARGRDTGIETDTTPVRSVMTPAVFSCHADTSAVSVVNQFLALNIHHLFVTDTSGVVIGVISPI